MRRTHAPGLLLLAALNACSGGEPAVAGPEVTRSMRGDTLVVRTESGSVWGTEAVLVPEVSIGALEGDIEYLFGSVRSLAVADDGTIYVVDQQVPDLRAFSPEGRFIRTLGRPGEGPGEIKAPDGGLAILSDGRILLRDPGNARIQVYGPDGAALETWAIRGGFNTGRQLFKDRNDNVYTQILVDAQADVRDWVIGLVRIHPDGTPGDTLVAPRTDFEEPELEARREDGENRNVSRTGVPFAPDEASTFHPDGYFVHGVGNEYRLVLHRPDDPVIIERSAEGVPVTGGEKAEEEARVTRNMRFTQPNWRWNGPPIPDRKALFDDIFPGEDGRIWVLVPQPGVEVEDTEYDPQDPDAVPDRWREPVAYDVFETDGSYMGRVRTPTGFRANPAPVFRGDNVWAVTQDDLGVQRVVRFRIDRAAATGQR